MYCTLHNLLTSSRPYWYRRVIHSLATRWTPLQHVHPALAGTQVAIDCVKTNLGSSWINHIHDINRYGLLRLLSTRRHSCCCRRSGFHYRRCLINDLQRLLLEVDFKLLFPSSFVGLLSSLLSPSRHFAFCGVWNKKCTEWFDTGLIYDNFNLKVSSKTELIKVASSLNRWEAEKKMKSWCNRCCNPNVVTEHRFVLASSGKRLKLKLRNLLFWSARLITVKYDPSLLDQCLSNYRKYWKHRIRFVKHRSNIGVRNKTTWVEDYHKAANQLRWLISQL